MKYVALYVLIVMLCKALGSTSLYVFATEDTNNYTPVLSTSVLLENAPPIVMLIDDSSKADWHIFNESDNDDDRIDVKRLYSCSSIFNQTLASPMFKRPVTYSNPEPYKSPEPYKNPAYTIPKARNSVVPKSCLHILHTGDPNTIKTTRKLSWSEPLTETDSPKPSQKYTNSIEPRTTTENTESLGAEQGSLPYTPVHLQSDDERLKLFESLGPYIKIVSRENLAVQQAQSRQESEYIIVQKAGVQSTRQKTKINDSESFCKCPPACCIS